MPEHIRALIVILTVSTIGLYIIRPLLKKMDLDDNFWLYVKSWYAVTCLAFLSHSVFVFFTLLVFFLHFVKPVKSSTRIALFVFLALSLPNFKFIIPGFASIQYFAQLSYVHLLILVLLSPSIKIGDIGRVKSDKYFIVFFIFLSIMDFRDVSLTEGLRRSLYYFVEIIIPYLVVSRSIKSKVDVKEIFSALLIPIFIMAIMAIPEVLKSWHFYTAVSLVLDDIGKTVTTSYKYREGYLRAYGPYGAIALGYYIALSITVLLTAYFDKIGRIIYLVMGLLLVGLLLTFSRGPWISFVLMIASYALLAGRFKILVIRTILLGILVSPLLLMTGFGDKIIRVLPYIGSSQNQVNVDYRKKLFEVSIDIASESPLLGDNNIYNHPKMQQLVQGEGIIDIVNTYLQYLLEYGYIGLGLFISLFSVAFMSLWKGRKHCLAVNNYESYMIQNTLIAMLLGTLILIATVSSLGNILLNAIVWILISVSISFSTSIYGKEPINDARQNKSYNA